MYSLLFGLLSKGIFYMVRVTEKVVEYTFSIMMEKYNFQ